MIKGEKSERYCAAMNHTEQTSRTELETNKGKNKFNKEKWVETRGGREKEMFLF